MAQNRIERRTFNFTELRVKREEGKPPKIEGHAAVFDVETDLGWFREKVARTAFDETMGADVRALFNHDPNHVLGRTKARTLEIWTDNKGLGFRATPPDTQLARDLLVSIERGDISGASFSFETIKDSWERGKDKEADLRTLEKVNLFDVGPVTFPAYRETDVAVRSRDQWKERETAHANEISRRAKQREREMQLAEAGKIVR